MKLNLPFASVVLQIIVVAIAGILIVLVQDFYYPDAGQKALDKSPEYSFQNNVWTNEVYGKLEQIGNSGSLTHLKFTGKMELTQQYIYDVKVYNKQMQDVMRILNYQGQVASNLAGDLVKFAGKTFPTMSAEERMAITEEMKALNDIAIKQTKTKNDIEALSVKLNQAFPSEKAEMDTAQKVNLAMEQISVAKELFTHPDVYVNDRNYLINLIQEFGGAEFNLFKRYDSLVKKFNEIDDKQDLKKKWLQILIAACSAYILIKKEFAKLAEVKKRRD